MKHLVYLLQKAPREHPMHVMDALGIAYQIGVSQPLFDCWHFWNCEKLPDSLPRFLQVMTAQPVDSIGFGLTKEDVAAIKDLAETKHRLLVQTKLRLRRQLLSKLNKR